MTELYTREILRLAAEVPHRVGFAELDDAREWRSATCGSRLRMMLDVADGRIVGMRQAVEACAFGQAAAALVGAHAGDAQFAEVIGIDEAVSAWLVEGGEAPWPGLEALAPARAKGGRHGAILLPFRALSDLAREDAR